MLLKATPTLAAHTLAHSHSCSVPIIVPLSLPLMPTMNSAISFSFLISLLLLLLLLGHFCVTCTHAVGRWQRQERGASVHTHRLFIYIVVVAAAVGVCLTRYANYFYAFSHCLFGYFIIPQQIEADGESERERDREIDRKRVCVSLCNCLSQLLSNFPRAALILQQLQAEREKIEREAHVLLQRHTAAGMHVHGDRSSDSGRERDTHTQSRSATTAAVELLSCLLSCALSCCT